MLAELRWTTAKLDDPKNDRQALRTGWLGWGWRWWGRPRCAGPNPRMDSPPLQENSSFEPPASPSVCCTAPSTAHCSVEPECSVTPPNITPLLIDLACKIIARAINPKAEEPWISHDQTSSCSCLSCQNAVKCVCVCVLCVRDCFLN